MIELIAFLVPLFLQNPQTKWEKDQNEEALCLSLI